MELKKMTALMLFFAEVPYFYALKRTQHGFISNK